MTSASGGIATSAPTALMRPSATTTVPFSSTGPATGTMRAFVTAKKRGSPPCARAAGAKLSATMAQIPRMTKDRTSRRDTEADFISPPGGNEFLGPAQDLKARQKRRWMLTGGRGYVNY